MNVVRAAPPFVVAVVLPHLVEAQVRHVVSIFRVEPPLDPIGLLLLLVVTWDDPDVLEGHHRRDRQDLRLAFVMHGQNQQLRHPRLQREPVHQFPQLGNAPVLVESAEPEQG
eukprot:CAMPEP_0114537676 /NCGR_PEP_ID=MMETSP0109-20121206/29709_1 /TAXON_ID=29199 /ORGANISM="Chlorarachnion reptans, Strain CCCM449" /LENGTH=111 /DNA_ID=CAMNT_0001721589 /DNA_START=564 /DNA_END=895 /DNA_ORIENTATION=-